MICETCGLLPGRAFEAACLQFFPQILLFIRELARQSFDGNAVLRAEVAPKDEAQIELSGFIGNSVVDFRVLLSGHSCTLTLVSMTKSLSAFSKIVHRPLKAERGAERPGRVECQAHGSGRHGMCGRNPKCKGRTLKVRPFWIAFAVVLFMRR